MVAAAAAGVTSHSHTLVAVSCWLKNNNAFDDLAVHRLLISLYFFVLPSVSPPSLQAFLSFLCLQPFHFSSPNTTDIFLLRVWCSLLGHPLRFLLCYCKEEKWRCDRIQKERKEGKESGEDEGGGHQPGRARDKRGWIRRSYEAKKQTNH